MLRRGHVLAGDPRVFATAFGARRPKDAPFIVAALGASLTANYAGDGTCRRPGWLLPAITMLRDSYGNASLVNLGEAAHSISRHRACQVPSEASLVIVDAATVHTREDLLRATLTMLARRRPAPVLLLIHFPRWCVPSTTEVAKHGGIPALVQLHQTADCYRPERLRAALALAREKEARLNQLAVELGAAALSINAAFSAEVSAGTHGFSPRQLTSDGLHPSERGLGRYSKLAAALITSFLRRQSLLARGAPHRRAAPTTAASGGGDDLPNANECARDTWTVADFQAAAPPRGAVDWAQSRGWQLTTYDTATSFEATGCGHGAAQAQHGGRRCPKAKRGLTALRAGSHLSIPLGRLGTGKHIELTYLSSWEGMGRATLECSGACECDAMAHHIDAHRGESLPAADRLVSVWMTRSITVSRAAAADSDNASLPCVLGLTVRDDTSSGGHKFKVASVRVRS